MRFIVAVGGNAILRRGDAGTIEQQTAHATDILMHVAEALSEDHQIVLTHGNGPIVGNIVVRNEAARDRIPPMPLYIDGADSQGGIGFMLASVLATALRRTGRPRPVATLVTQVVVDPGDPAFHRPTKPIGPAFTEVEAEELSRAEGWFFLESDDATFRRIVPSPEPLRIVEADSISRLCAAGTAVIACGGGGIPVVEDDEGALHGVDAVIDKDLASSLLARVLDADVLVILMEAPAVQIGWGAPDAVTLGRVSVDELQTFVADGAFSKGAMEPKVRAALAFTSATGRPSIICRAEDLTAALEGDAGTYLAP